jgi:hypothetical protein
VHPPRQSIDRWLCDACWMEGAGRIRSATRVRRCAGDCRFRCPTLMVAHGARHRACGPALLLFRRRSPGHRAVGQPRVDLLSVLADILVGRQIERERHRLDVPRPEEWEDVSREAQIARRLRPARGVGWGRALAVWGRSAARRTVAATRASTRRTSPSELLGQGPTSRLTVRRAVRFQRRTGPAALRTTRRRGSWSGRRWRSSREG